MKTIKDLLTEHKFFHEMAPEMLEFIAGCGKNMHFTPGEFIGKQGDPADFLYVIREGNIALQLVHPTQGSLTIRSLRGGEIAGFSWIIPPYHLQFDLRALEHTSAVALDGTCLRKKCEEDYKLGYYLMKQSATVMMQRLVDTRIQLLDIYGARV